MKGPVVHIEKDFVVIRDDLGSYILVETTNPEDVEVGNVISGELRSLGSTKLLNQSTGQYFNAIIQDFDCSKSVIKEHIRRA